LHTHTHVVAAGHEMVVVVFLHWVSHSTILGVAHAIICHKLAVVIAGIAHGVGVAHHSWLLKAIEVTHHTLLLLL
jgi:hypothetical protein